MRTFINTAGDVFSPRVLIASIVGPNQSRWLQRFLDSLDKLKYPHDKLTYAFLTSNSNDDTSEIINAFETTHQGDIKWDRFHNKGRVFLKGCDIDMGGVSRYMKLSTLRNLLLFEALEEEDYVLMVDSDIVDLPSDLIQQLMKTPGDVVAPLVMIEDFREFGDEYFYDRLAFIAKNGEPFDHFYPYIPDDDMLPSSPFEVASVGTCYLCKSSIFRNGVRYMSDENISEQIGFCNRVRQRGYNIFVNPNVRVLHVNFEKFGLQFKL